MSAHPVFRLRVDAAAPVQQTGLTCGSAVATVARMLREDAFATELLGPPHAPTGGAAAARFAAYEAAVHRRTNAVRSPTGRLQLPWPRALGTPPWGLAAELTRLTGRRYRTMWVRLRPTATRTRLAGDLARRTAPDLPAALYVGSRWLPRHVGLLVPQDGALVAYDPARGRVDPVGAAGWRQRRPGLLGWPVTWWVVSPR